MPANRIDRIFVGNDSPPKELLHTIILSLDDHYPDSNIQSSNPGFSGTSATRIVQIEGRQFVIEVTQIV